MELQSTARKKLSLLEKKYAQFFRFSNRSQGSNKTQTLVTQFCGKSFFYSLLSPNFSHLAIGAVITLKSHRTGGGYLHSHYHLFPEGVGAKQQQVTAYAHKDDNNRWVPELYGSKNKVLSIFEYFIIRFLVKRWNAEPKIKNLAALNKEEGGGEGNKTDSATGRIREKAKEEVEDEEEEVELVRHGDLIRLEHVMTGRNIHTHQEPAPVSKKMYQVRHLSHAKKRKKNQLLCDFFRGFFGSKKSGSSLSLTRSSHFFTTTTSRKEKKIYFHFFFQVTGYGEKGQGDANDVWRVEIVGGSEGDPVQTVNSKIKLYHYFLKVKFECCCFPAQ